MKNSLAIKFLAVLLCTLSLLGALGSGLCLGLLGAAGALGEKSVAQLVEEDTASQKQWFAQEAAIFWASGEYGGMPQEIVDARIRTAQSNFFQEGKVFFSILDQEGNVLFSNYGGQENVTSVSFRFDAISFDRFLSYGNVFQDEVEAADTEEAADAELMIPIASGRLRTENAYTTYFYDQTSGRLFQYIVCPGRAPGVEVVLYLAPGAEKNGGSWMLLDALWHRKGLLVGTLVGCLLLFAMCAVYLCSSAGHRHGTDDLHPAGLNALPLDLYAAGVAGTAFMAVMIAEEFSRWVIQQNWQTILLCVGGLGFVVCLIFVAFCFAFAAQIKMPGGYWLRNTICGRLLRLACLLTKKLWHGVCWIVPRTVRLIMRIFRDLWKVTAALFGLTFDLLRKLFRWLNRLLRGMGRALERFFSLLPVMWQWLVIGFVLLIVLFLALDSRDHRRVWLALAFCAAVAVYGAFCFGTLLDGVKRMRSGRLDDKVDSKYLVGCFREFSEELNGLADVAVEAAEKQLRSDRMKTELITNVSHDIKTPLTSIINYVDLLEKPHTDEQQRQYLEVLSRQSGRMKKLVEDLMEMSKASTGNIPVEITRVDAVEAVNQALGEFSDKLAAAGLTPVLRHDDDVFVLADGRLLWRSMSNLLSNAVKYALPGTRLYVDVSRTDDSAVISFKNISGAQLNISADELMERFVRGDSSRNTEGSGLGLNITKSLMELQKGQLRLLVDGDLFKATLIFPKAQ